MEGSGTKLKFQREFTSVIMSICFEQVSKEVHKDPEPQIGCQDYRDFLDKLLRCEGKDANQ